MALHIYRFQKIRISTSYTQLVIWFFKSVGGLPITRPYGMPQYTLTMSASHHFISYTYRSTAGWYFPRFAAPCQLKSFGMQSKFARLICTPGNDRTLLAAIYCISYSGRPHQEMTLTYIQMMHLLASCILLRVAADMIQQLARPVSKKLNPWCWSRSRSHAAPLRHI